MNIEELFLLFTEKDSDVQTFHPDFDTVGEWENRAVTIFIGLDDDVELEMDSWFIGDKEPSVVRYGKGDILVVLGMRRHRGVRCRVEGGCYRIGCHSVKPNRNPNREVVQGVR